MPADLQGFSDIAAALLATGAVIGIAVGILIADFAWGREERREMRP